MARFTGNRCMYKLTHTTPSGKSLKSQPSYGPYSHQKLQMYLWIFLSIAQMMENLVLADSTICHCVSHLSGNQQSPPCIAFSSPKKLTVCMTTFPPPTLSQRTEIFQRFWNRWRPIFRTYTLSCSREKLKKKLLVRISTVLNSYFRMFEALRTSWFFNFGKAPQNFIWKLGKLRGW